MNGWPPIILAVALHAVLLLIVAWDLYAAATGNLAHSVSSIIRNWSVDFPVLPLAVGIVLGHLFWSFR